MSRNGAQSARGGVRTEPTYGSVVSTGAHTARGEKRTPAKRPVTGAKKPTNTTSAAQL